MATRQIKMPVSDETVTAVTEVHSQGKRPEVGRYLLQVDRQTKGSYQTTEEVEAAGIKIKAGHPAVQVAVYDSIDFLNKILGASASS